MSDKDTYIDPETGKKYKLSDFDERREWSKAKAKKKKVRESPGSFLPNILGK